MILILVAKETTLLRLLLIEVGLQDKDGQYIEIKIIKSVGTRQIKDNVMSQEGKISLRTLISITILATPANPSILFFLKGDNQESIILAHKPVFHVQTKHIDIQHHYICDKVIIKRIDLKYIRTSKMLEDKLTKALTQAKFHLFVQQIQMV